MADINDPYEKATKLVKRRYDLSKKYTRPYFERFIENYEHYLAHLSVPQGQDYPLNSEMVVPVSYQVIEKILPRMIGKDPEFTVQAREPNDVKFEEPWRHLIHYQYNNPALTLMGEPIYLKLYNILKEALITGTGIGMYYWRREVKPKTKYQMGLKLAGIDFGEKSPEFVKDLAEKIGAKPSWNKKVVKEKVVDDPDVQYIPIWKFYPDPTARSIGGMKWCIIRDEVSFDELVAEKDLNGYEKSALQEVYDNLVKENGGVKENDRFEKDFKDLFDKEDYTFKDKTNPKLERLMMWEDNRLTVTIGRKITIRDGENPFDLKRKPVFAMKDIPIPGEFYAWGEVDPIKKLEDGMTDMMNMRFDNIVQSLMKMWAVNPDLLVDTEAEMTPTPNGIVRVRDTERAFREMPVSDVTGSSYKEASEINNLIQETAGTMDYAKRGELGQGQSTVGGMRMVQQAANARFAQKMKLFEKLSLKVVGNAFIELDRQYIEKERAIRITGEHGKELKKIKPADLRSNVGYMDLDVIPNSTQAVDKQFETLKWNAIVDRIGRPPFDDLPREILDKIAAKYWKAYGIKEAPLWIKRIQEARDEQQDEQAEQIAEALKQEVRKGTSPEGQGGQGIRSQENAAVPKERVSNREQPISEPSVQHGAVTRTPVASENEMARRREQARRRSIPIGFSKAGMGQTPGAR